MREREAWPELSDRDPKCQDPVTAVSTRNRNVPVLNEIEMSPDDGLWALCETRLRVLQGAVGASARPRGRQRP
jgi:hypothetical protein